GSGHRAAGRRAFRRRAAGQRIARHCERGAGRRKRVNRGPAGACRGSGARVGCPTPCATLAAAGEAARGSDCRTARARSRTQENEHTMPIGAPELIIILVIALLILGPGKLPEVGASLGKTIREFRKASSDVQDAVKVDVSTAPLPPQASAAPAAPAAPA